MRAGHTVYQGAIAILAVATMLTVAGLPVVAEEPGTSPSLALPAEASIDEDARSALIDEPGQPPESFDLGAAEREALRQADLLPAEDWEVEALAAALGDDPEAALAFVRDRIAFDPYRGVLRGAQGTLAARSGNAFDRALLLAAILAASGSETRFAFGALDDATVEDLLTGAADGATLPIQGPHPSEVMTIDAAALAKRARRDNALLRLALGDTFSDASAAAERAGQADAIRQHAWVQVDNGDGNWVDLDPSSPADSPGSSLVEAEMVAAEMPLEASQSVLIRVVAETLEDTTLREQAVLEEELPAVEAASGELWLHFQPLLSGLSGSIVEAMGEAQWQPILIVDGEGRAGTEFALGSSGDPNDFFGGFLGDGGPVLTALRLELESRIPGDEPRTSERVLFDRVLPADRANGVFVVDLLEPLPADGAPPLALSTLHHVMVSNGGSSLRNHAVGRAFAANFIGNDLGDPELVAELPLHDLLLPLAVSDQTLATASERLIIDGLSADPEVRAFVGRPRIFLSSFSALPGVIDGTAVITDLALDDVSFVTRPGGGIETVAQQRLWYGALQTALETEMALQRAQAVEPSSRVLQSVSLEMTDRLAVLGADDLESVPPTSPALRSVLGAGGIAVVTGEPSEAGSFWAIDSTTGATSSILEPGLRVGFVGGGNYTNAVTSGVRWVIDETSARTLGYIKDGTYYRYARTPPARCEPGPEYTVILGCVSIPASWTLGVTIGATAVAVAAWSTALFRTLGALR